MNNNYKSALSFNNLKDKNYQSKEFKKMKTVRHIRKSFTQFSILYMKFWRNQTVWEYSRMIQVMTEVHRAGQKRLSNIKAVPDDTKLPSLFNSILFSHRWRIFHTGFNSAYCCHRSWGSFSNVMAESKISLTTIKIQHPVRYLDVGSFFEKEVWGSWSEFLLSKERCH